MFFLSLDVSFCKYFILFSTVHLQNSRSCVDLMGILSCAVLLGGLIPVVAAEISQFFKKGWGSVF